ncbi:MAG TPA: 3-oxoacyl-[acyl-carrier-protein] reductase [Ignavibacteria bacterium]|nr:3-oxoacyl-[acyl-carrier-protein] reductase [Ignavibacteria bacterium]HMR41794.1 3-oxoacyl-[acyl-carrier-protein] reductase [Ignavibacteria bacterium]
MHDFKDKIVLITGGSRGIGKAIAESFAESGATVIVTYKNAIDDEYFKSINIRHYKCDVADGKSVQEMVDAIIKEHTKIDVLVNNAGITKDGLLMRMSEEDWEAVIDTNLKGVFNMTKAVTRGMMSKRYGKVVNITSISGVMGNPGQANYSASKAGVIGFTKAAARELAARNININAIAPGFIETEMTDKLTDEVKQNYLNSIPMKRFGSGSDIANVVKFLSSDYAGYITGQTIIADGGIIMS